MVMLLLIYCMFTDKLLSGKDVLLMGADESTMAYKGTTTIDDIDVDIWNGCLYIGASDTTINATYYFTRKQA